MSFLDRFKRKASDERTPPAAFEAKLESQAPARQPEAANSPATTAASGQNAAPKKDKDPAPTSNEPQHDVVLELGDFLPRSPPQFLKEPAPDPQMPLSFDIADLAERISNGHTTIPISEIQHRAPGAFRGPVLESQDSEVRFPWQKVMNLLNAFKAAHPEAGSRGLSSAAAEALAQKLRSRRTSRNIIPGSPADTQNAPCVTAPYTAAPAPSASAVPAAPRPPEIVIPAANAEEDERMSKEDALKARDTLRSTLARIKGEYERVLSAGEVQRRGLIDEREKMVVELVQAKREIEDKDEQVDFEKSVAAKSTENLSKTQKERDAYKIELSNLKAEMNKSGHEKRIKDLIAERDALAQQQAQLSKQLTDLQKRGKLGALTAAAETAAPAAAERSQKEHQRQLDELQRRINVLETAQRDSAQELVRERDAKTKIERQLATADRVQQESAAKIQEVQATLQREHEAALRKREADSQRALKETQDQVASLTATRTKLAADLDDARKKLAAAQEAAAGAPAPEAWEARATAQFEADIESYRTRIKALLQEKETLAGDKQKLAEQFATQAQELTQRTEEKAALAKAQGEAAAKGDATRFAAENEKLQGQIKTLEAERQSLAGKIKTLEEKSVAAGNTAAGLQKLSTEKDALSAELAKAKSELTQTAAKHQQELQQLQQAGAQRLAAAAPSAELNQLRSELEAARTGSNTTITTLRAETKKALADRDAAIKERETLNNELKALKTGQQKAGEQQQTDARALAELRSVQEKLIVERNTLAEEIAKARTAQEAASAEAKQVAGERDGLRAKTETLAKELAGWESLATETNTARGVLEKSLADVSKQRDDLQRKIDAMSGELAGAKQEHGLAFAALDKDRDALRTAKDALAIELATARTSQEKALTEIRAQHDALGKTKSETDAKLSEALKLIESLQAKLQTAETALTETSAALKAREESATKQAREHGETLTAATGKHELALTALAAEKDAALAKLASEKATLAAEVDDRLAALRASHETLIHKLRDEKAEAIAALRAELDGTVAALTTDRDKIRDALAEAERKHPAEITALVEARESARRDAATVAERLAAISVEAEQKQKQITEDLAAALAEKERLASEFEQAKETHKAQAGVFASEFKAVVKQRDNALTHLETERARLAEKTAAFDRDRASMATAEQEAQTRFDRDLARARRERDSIAQQRDSLRNRIEKLVEEQRQMLEDMTSQAAFTSMKHSEPTPAAASSPEESESAEEPLVARNKGRETTKKKEPNIIDITEAEIVSPLQGGEGRLKMPRVRPVIIPPPQVRML